MYNSSRKFQNRISASNSRQKRKKQREKLELQKEYLEREVHSNSLRRTAAEAEFHVRMKQMEETLTLAKSLALHSQGRIDFAVIKETEALLERPPPVCTNTHSLNPSSALEPPLSSTMLSEELPLTIEELPDLSILLAEESNAPDLFYPPYSLSQEKSSLPGVSLETILPPLAYEIKV